MKVMKTGARLLGLTAIAGVAGCSFHEGSRPSAAETQSSGVTSGAAPVDQVRFYPRAGRAKRMVGGKFQGSNTNATSGFVDLATIAKTPSDRRWSEIRLANTQPYRYVRYLAPDGSYGNVAEIEFWGGTTKLRGTSFGSAASSSGAGNTYDKAFDGDTATFFEASAANGAHVGLDLGLPLGSPPAGCTPTVHEAESMTKSTGGAVSGGWNLWANGHLAGSHEFASGRTTITVVASGTPAAGVWPEMRVLVGGALVGRATVSASTWTAYDFAFDATSGAKEIRIEFTNDLVSGAEDRNLLVDKVTVSCVTAGGTGGTGGTGTGGTGGTGTGGTGAGGTGSGGTGGSATGGTGGSGSGGTGTGGTGGSPASVERPAELCPSPLGPAATSTPRVVVGTGTPESCTEAALRTAVAGGGVITFNCGAGTKTISITSPLVAPTDRDTTIDGNDRIVLDGGGTTQILRASRENFRANDRVLTVQRLVMQRGRDLGAGYVPRDGTKTCAWGYKTGGGGAIYVRDVNLHVWGVTFLDNQGPAIGPDVAGGAIYAFGAKEITIASSIFRRNAASNGGGVGGLHVSARLYNVIFEHNRATGLLANFGGATGCPTFNHAEQGGAGGLGGAFYSDGQDPGDTFCGVRMSDNTSGDLGGAVFRSAYWGLIAAQAKQIVTWDRSTFERNSSAAGGGGAAYVNNALFVVRNSSFTGNESNGADGGGLKITGVTVQFDTVGFTNNSGSWGGGIAHWGPGPEGKGTATGVTFSGNAPNAWVGDFPL
jgi:hypothetical protein